MKKNDKEITVNYADKLMETSKIFIFKELCSVESMNTGDLLNIILSAHLSSCFTTMRVIANSSDNEEILPKLNKFIKKFEEILFTIDPISKVEIKDNYKGNE